MERRKFVGRQVAGGEAAHTVGVASPESAPADGDAPADARIATDGQRSGFSAPTLLDFGALYRRARSLRNQYFRADPFPHILLEEFLSAAHVQRLLDELANSQKGLSGSGDKAHSASADPAAARFGCKRQDEERLPTDRA